MALNNNETFLTPNYMTSFKCIGKDCIDTCCNGLHIEIDKETYENYINSSDKKINSISKKYISKNNTETSLSYANVNSKNRSCPFLADNKSCNAYNILGKDSLSVACSTYPRIVKKLGNLSFIAGELSCPEISKLCLSTPNIKINECKKNELKNIFNSNKINTIDIQQDLTDRIKDFFEMAFSKLSNKDTLFQNLEEIILYFYNIKNKIDNFYQSNAFLYEKEKLKKSNLLYQSHLLPKMYFKENLSQHSRFLRIRIKAAEKSKYFELTEDDFKIKYINNHNNKLNKFIRNNNFIYKNFFLNEFLRNIDCFLLSEDYFDNFIRRFLFKINVSNFLINCLTFEENKKIDLNDYIEVISAVSKTFQNSKEANMLMINFFKKLDKNNLFLRLFDIY
tara:strand:- start:1091 stop:2269 length:1179 start_codon:yes stop_codon:yes gene_type:complete